MLFWGPEFSHAPLENRTGAGSLPGDGDRGRWRVHACVCACVVGGCPSMGGWSDHVKHKEKVAAHERQETSLPKGEAGDHHSRFQRQRRSWRREMSKEVPERSRRDVPQGVSFLVEG